MIYASLWLIYRSLVDNGNLLTEQINLYKIVNVLLLMLFLSFLLLILFADAKQPILHCLLIARCIIVF